MDALVGGSCDSFFFLLYAQLILSFLPYLYSITLRMVECCMLSFPALLPRLFILSFLFGSSFFYNTAFFSLFWMHAHTHDVDQASLLFLCSRCKAKHAQLL